MSKVEMLIICTAFGIIGWCLMGAVQGGLRNRFVPGSTFSVGSDSFVVLEHDKNGTIVIQDSQDRQFKVDLRKESFSTLWSITVDSPLPETAIEFHPHPTLHLGALAESPIKVGDHVKGYFDRDKAFVTGVVTTIYRYRGKIIYGVQLDNNQTHVGFTLDELTKLP